MTHKSGISILRSDERNPGVRLRPLRLNVIGEAPSYIPLSDWEQRVTEETRIVNASALYLGFGRTHVWLYWRRRPVNAGWTGRWVEYRDTQKEHLTEEES